MRRINEKIGAAIEKARLKTGKSAGDVAREIGITGVAVRAIERGSSGALPETLEAMAIAAGLTRARTDKLHAMAGHVRPAVHAALVACPAKWDAVLAFISEDAAETDGPPPRAMPGVSIAATTETEDG